MIISVEKAKNGLLRYLENEVARKATGLQKFSTYFVIGSVSGKADSFISGLQDNELVKMLDLFDESGNIKLDEVYAAAKQAMEKSESVTIYGVTFNGNDIDMLYRYMSA